MQAIQEERGCHYGIIGMAVASATAQRAVVIAD
jgi:hypothetical protein